MKRFIQCLIVVALLVPLVRSAMGDRKSVSWDEFVKNSELIFYGRLIKAEMVNKDNLPDANGTQIRHTYQIYDVYKGDTLKEVTFNTEMYVDFEIDINTEVNSPAIIALRKHQDQWHLCSTWKKRYERTKDLRGLLVYEIDSYIRDIPEQFSETVEIMVQYGDEYKPEQKKRFTEKAVEKNLAAAIAAVK